MDDLFAVLALVASWAAILTGSSFMLVGAFGLIRLPDFWSRLHAAGIIDSAGAFMILLGLAIQAGWTLVAVKIGLIALFLFLTGPTSSHAVANAAFVSGSRPLDMVDDATADDDALGHRPSGPF